MKHPLRFYRAAKATAKDVAMIFIISFIVGLGIGLAGAAFCHHLKHGGMPTSTANGGGR